MKSLFRSISILLVCWFFAQPKASAQSLLAYISSPGTQSSFLASTPGAQTETFNSLPLGNQTGSYVSPIGTYQFSSSAQGAILAADQFGGANGSQYMSFGAQSGTTTPITITLNGNYNYFGFWFSAGDTNNGITLYSNGTQFARFSTANIISLLSSPTVTAVNGTTYSSSAYFGNPNNGQDTSEPFAYVEIVATSGTFDQIVLDNSGSTATGFEQDNETVYFGSGGVTVPGTDVLVGSLPIVPEPSHYAVLFGGLILCLVMAHRFYQKSATPILA